MQKRLIIISLIIFHLSFTANAQMKMDFLPVSGFAFYTDFKQISLIGEINSVTAIARNYVSANNYQQVLSIQSKLNSFKNTIDLYKLLKITIVSFAVVLLVLLVLCYHFRINKRQKREIDFKNRLLQNSIIEKDEMILSRERLLKEIHHRVKNNLHAVICLLESQAKYLKDDALQAIQTSEHRIYAMLLIHQKLYFSNEPKTINMSIYLTEFLNYLSESFGTPGKISMKIEIMPLELRMSKAVPVALIVNEVVTNSIKHAFPGGIGVIHIRIKKNDGYVVIEIKDDGIGIDTALANENPITFGLKLMNGLSEDIGAEITFANQGGTLVTLKFEEDSFNLRVIGPFLNSGSEFSTTSSDTDELRFA